MKRIKIFVSFFLLVLSVLIMSHREPDIKKFKVMYMIMEAEKLNAFLAGKPDTYTIYFTNKYERFNWRRDEVQLRGYGYYKDGKEAPLEMTMPGLLFSLKDSYKLRSERTIGSYEISKLQLQKFMAANPAKYYILKPDISGTFTDFVSYKLYASNVNSNLKEQNITLSFELDPCPPARPNYEDDNAQ